MKSIYCMILILLLTGCTGSQGGWHWEHVQGLDAAQRERDLADCRYYASITDFRAFGADRPVVVQDWDEPVQECMAKRGWIFVESVKNLDR